MYLKTIQIYGFKSFADKITFDFTKDINAIVGPNGSGKSNVVDAVRWVLGEGANKQIRATDTTSVIFSGSKSRKPLNSAYVEIVFDNTDRHLPIDFNEVSIKRVLYRTGDNEYYLNGEKCRLKDITELLTDSGAAKESFNIIGQGKIDEILSTKPYDRRVIFEEAAGVLKYKKRKEEAIRKLERTNNNINRVNDIIHELETNLEPLKIQRDAAVLYNEYQEKLTNYDISLMIYDVDNYSDEFNNCQNKINELNDKITELNANNASSDALVLENKEKLAKLDEEINKANGLILEYTRDLEKQDADIRLLRERKKYVSSGENETNVNSIKESLLEKNSELEKLKNEISLLDEKIKLNDEDIINNTTKLNEIKNDLNKKEQKINDNNREIARIKYQIEILEETINNGGSVPGSIKALINNPLFNGVHDVIGNLIKVDNEYALAVSTALGGASNYLVVDDRNLASRMVTYLKEKKLGRATFYPLDVIKARYVDSENLAKIKGEDGFINTIDKVIDYDDLYKNVILNQLGNVLMVDNIDNANKISKMVQNRYKVVTLDGQVVNVGGSITGGDKIKSNDVISKKYELDDLNRKLKNYNDKNKEYLVETTEYSKRITTYQDSIDVARSNKMVLNSELDNKNNLLSLLEQDIAKLSSEVNDIETISNNTSDDAESEMVAKYYQIKSDIDRVNKEIDEEKLVREKLNKDIEEATELNRTSMLNTSKMERNMHDIEIKASKLEVKMDTILNSLNEEYHITYKEARNNYKLEEDPEIVRREVNSLKDKIKDIGIVNLGAIQEYERVSSRYEFLVKQKDDLNKAEDTLLKIIEDMDEVMKDKFIKTFNDIRVEFKKVFRELFRGGSADIYLENPEDILETGICLEATPPGKSLKNVSALSGGEKTFTAIALLFAILNVRPVPFCLFDEVEAALDEANVDAFGEYLNKYRDKTQFIIITHKKRTMEYVDTLYGVTMQESGVSKRVSVKLGELK